MRGRKVDMHFARAAKMSRSSRLVDAPPMLVPSADQHRVPTCSVGDGSMGHRRLASCRAPRHCRLSTPPSSRDGGVERLLLRSLRGGIANGHVSTTPTPSATTAAPAPSTQTAPTAPTARATASSARASARVRAPVRAAKSTRAASRARAAPSARSSARAVSLARALARAARRLASTVLPRWAQRLCVRPRKQLTD